MKLKTIAASLFCLASSFFPNCTFGGDSDTKAATAIQNSTPTPLDIFTLESTYTGASTVRPAFPTAQQNAVHTDFNFGRRFPVTGQWYLRLGVEYDRYDFGGSPSFLPQHLQGASAVIAYEYVIQGFAGAAIELHPGFYFENDVTGNAFSVPIDLYSGFKISGEKVFGMIGLSEGQFLSPAVTPIGGVIWLVDDKTRLEAIFPRPSLVHTLNDDWELRGVCDLHGFGFRTDKRTPAGVVQPPQDHRGSVVMYQFYQIGALVTYSHIKPFQVSVGAGYNIQRQFNFFRDDYEQKYKASGAPYVKVSVEADF